MNKNTTLFKRPMFGSLAAAATAFAGGVVMLNPSSWAQETVVEKASYVQLVEELEMELDEALRKNQDLEAKVQNLGSALGVLAECESETRKTVEALRESHEKAVINLELFNVALEREGGEDLKDLLVRAASDLRLAEEESGRLAEAVVQMLGAFQDYLKEADDPDSEALASLKAAARTGEEALGLIGSEEGLAGEKTLADARVITVNPAYNLVLVNVGHREGMRVGTPISLRRKDRTVGSALVIDVRDAFSGAILLELTDPNDQIMVGDTLQIDPEGV